MSKNIRALIIALVVIFVVIPAVAWFLLSARSEQTTIEPTVSESSVSKPTPVLEPADK